MIAEAFTDEQKRYLEGFAAGAGIARSAAAPATFAGALGLTPDQMPRAQAAEDASTGVESIHADARCRTETAGGKLTNEDQAKRKKNPLDLWDEIDRHARAAQFPKGTDVFLFKFHGLFYVAPAQDSFMCRLRFPAGIVSAEQMRGVADLAELYGGGYADITTRANLQIRQIKPADTTAVLEGLQALGIVNRGSGADNVRNITASPTAGIDSQELIDTRPLARRLNHYILNHRELYGLPRKFNIAFDGGGAVSALDDTNDIGLSAVRVTGGTGIEPGVYFRLTLGGITGHKDFAFDTGILVKPDECIPAATAILRAFIEHGDRTDRKKARLKYVLERLGRDGFVREAEKHLPAEMGGWRRAGDAVIEPRPKINPMGHIGVHRQKQPGLHYVGVVTPVGRMTCEQLRGLADTAERFGSRTLRLTVWQNVLVSDVAGDDVPAVETALEAIGLTSRASAFRASLVACTGNTGCKFANTDTKKHALAIAGHLEERLRLDRPLNIHVTGCPHSCAQHFIGDVGLLGTKLQRGEEMVEGYRIFLGGGFGDGQGIARELGQAVTADDAAGVLEQFIERYVADRRPDETFAGYVRRLPDEALSQPATLPT